MSPCETCKGTGTVPRKVWTDIVTEVQKQGRRASRVRGSSYRGQAYKTIIRVPCEVCQGASRGP